MTTQKTMSADLAIIGGGAAGLSIASGAAQLGRKVVLFEKGEMGGDCLNSGCVPSKALIAAAARAHAMRTAGKFGVASVEPEVHWAQVKAHIHGVIETIAPIDSQERFEGMGVTVVREHAAFTGPRTVASQSLEVTAGDIVVATGSVPFIPPIPGLAETPFETNETIFHLDAAPSHLIVLGGGFIGAELAQAFARLGAAVTIVEMGAFLGRADAEAAAVVAASLRADGVTILEGVKAVAAEKADGGVALTLEGEGAPGRVAGSHLLVAVGRRQVHDALNLEAARVATDGRAIKTRPNLRSTSNKRVWVAGDAAGRQQFTHAAGLHASLFVQAALFRLRADAGATAMPSVAYTDPELAQIGLTEAEARAEHGSKVQVSRWSYEENDRAQTERDTEGFIKVISDKKGRLLGATLVGKNAGESLHVVGMAMANGLGMRAFTRLISPYPTRSEVVKRAASAFYSPKVFSPTAKFAVRMLQWLP